MIIKKILNDLESEPIPDSVIELSIVFTDDNDIRELNKAYRDKDKPTDVLSFSQLEGGNQIASNTLLGDIVISLDTAQSQATELGVSFNQELVRLIIHGILHLFGYDHEDVSEEVVKMMQNKEEELYLTYKNSKFH